MYRKLNNVLVLNVAIKFFYDYLVKYYSPLNINYIWNAGFVAGIFLVTQIASGFFF
jgi:quinol-cytochrome oxidoreductase complex cytochrome b subunit